MKYVKLAAIIAVSLLASAVVISASDYCLAKTQSTYYTAERVSTIRPGFSSSPRRANEHVALGYDYLWSLVTPQTLPRASRISDANTDWQPVYGQPWKVTDGKYIYPTNDFQAYYESGIDSHGIFQPTLADKSLLVNNLYPEKGPTWGVDDGFGWENGKETMTFIAYYNHHHIWYKVRDIINNLRDAYIYSGDMRYARAGLVLLNRIADIYPSLDLSVYNKEIFRNSHGGSGKGKAIGSIWEPALVSNFLFAYDAFFPALLENDEELVSYLSAKAEQYGLPAINSIDDVRKNIEDNLVRQVLPGVQAGQIHGNFGMHQRALAISAVVLDEPDGYTAKAITYLFQSGDGDILRVLMDVVDKDGYGNEASPSYNGIHRNTLADVAEVLQGYDHYAGADLTKNPKYMKMQSAGTALINLDMYVPSIGDSGGSGKPVAFQHSLPESVNLAGYGYTALRAGERSIDNDTRRVLWMYYGRNSVPHAHRDTLNIGIYAFGLDLSPDLGYPELARAGLPSRVNWTATTLSHNTVLVDKTPQRDQWVAIPKHYDDTDMVKVIDIEAPKAYPAIDLYRRTNIMIKVDDVNSYMVDFFRVKGGNNHHFSFHGAEGSVTVSGLQLIPQAKGTYLSERIAYADEKADNRSGFNYLYNVERDKSPAPQFIVDWDILDTWKVAPAGSDPHLRLTMLGQYTEVALADGKNPRRENLEYRYLIVRRTGSKLNSVFSSVIEPYDGTPFIEKIEQVVVKAAGEIVEQDVQAIRVQLTNGRVDYIINALDPNTEYVVDEKIVCKGFVGVYSEQNGQPLFAYVLDGTRLGPLASPVIDKKAGCLTGKVVDFTRELSSVNEIVVELEDVTNLPRNLDGLSIFVDTDGERNGTYQIQQSSLEDRTLTLNVGDITLIRGWQNANDFSKGYLYDIEPGAQFRIPLSWSMGGL